MSPKAIDGLDRSEGDEGGATAVRRDSETDDRLTTGRYLRRLAVDRRYCNLGEATVLPAARQAHSTTSRIFCH